ncbi:MAG: hypothetical protein BWY49_00730 [Candidatus Omnitrophica bacterium ADurb.Bin314]|nr:MAG: hypothetical protein BWY49_00730 [Candidatus Omnitrophica bacterium ADurb.Bin314]
MVVDNVHLDAAAHKILFEEIELLAKAIHGLDCVRV